MPPPVGSTGQFIDLTTSDVSDSDIESIDVGISGSASDADGKPPPQSSNTSGWSYNGEQIANSARTTKSSDEDRNSVENDMRSCISLSQKRKNSQSDGIMAHKRPKPSDSRTHTSAENIPFFNLQQLKKISVLFGINKPLGSQSRTSDRETGKTLTKQTEKNEDEAREQSVVNHPWLLHHVRPLDSNTSPSRENSSISAKKTAPGRPEKPPKASVPKQPAERRASSADRVNSTRKKRHNNYKDLFSPNQRPGPETVAPKTIASNKIAPTSTGSVPINPRPDATSAFTNEGGDKPEQARSGSIVINRVSSEATVLGLGVKATGNGLQHIQVEEIQPERTIQVTRPPGKRRAERDRRRSELAKVLRPTARPRCEASQPRRRETGTIQVIRPPGKRRAERDRRRSELAKVLRPTARPRYDEARQPRRRETGNGVLETEDQLPGTQPSSARVYACSQPSSQTISNTIGTRGEAHQPTRKHTSSSAALAETALLRAQKPRHVVARSKFQSQPTGSSTSPITASQRPLSRAIAEEAGCEDRPEAHKPPDVATQRFDGVTRTQPAIRNCLPQTRKTVNIPAIDKCPIPRPPRTMGNVFDDAAADMQALFAQYEKKRTTTLVDSLPANMIMTQPDSQSRARAARNIGIREKDEVQRQEKLFRKQLGRIRHKVRKDYPDETDEVRDSIIEERFNTYKDKKIRRDLNERGQFKAGLLTVDFLESNRGRGAFDGEEVDLDARRVPASQALEPIQTIVHYPVYMTEPLEEGQNYENFMKRTNSFGKLESANFYAKRLLEGPSSPTSKRSRDISRRVVSQSIVYPNGLLFGSVRLGDGRGIFVIVRKEEMLFGNLDPDALRNKWIDEDVLDSYRKRYDVWSVKLVPKAWIDKEADDEEARAARDRADERAKERQKRREERRRSKKQQDVGDKGAKSVTADDDPQGLEGAKLRAALNALSNPTSNPRLDANNEPDEESADERSENSDDDGTDDEAHSQASDETVCCDDNGPSSRPGPPYGSPYARYPNFYADYAVRNECVASYTDLHLANEQALDLARQAWRPRTALMDAVLHYENAVLPAVRAAAAGLGDDDEQGLALQFPEFPGHKDHRPWGFVWAQITVQETELQGPRELGVDFVIDMTSSAYRPTVAERAELNVDLNDDEQDEHNGDAVDGSESEREEGEEGTAAGAFGDDEDDEDAVSEED